MQGLTECWFKICDIDECLLVNKHSSQKESLTQTIKKEIALPLLL